MTHLWYLIYKLSRTHKENLQFSPQIVLGVLRTLNMHVLDFCVVCVVQSVGVHVYFIVFICGFVQVLFLSLVVNF